MAKKLTARDIFGRLLIDTLSKTEHEAELERTAHLICTIKQCRSVKQQLFLDTIKDTIHKGNTAMDLMLSYCDLPLGSSQQQCIDCFKTKEEAQTKYSELCIQSSGRIKRLFSEKNKILLELLETAHD